MEDHDPDDRHVTYREFVTELKSFRNETRVLIVAALVVLRFDVPKEVTAAALGLAVAVAVGKTLGAFLFKN